MKYHDHDQWWPIVYVSVYMMSGSIMNMQWWNFCSQSHDLYWCVGVPFCGKVVMCMYTCVLFVYALHRPIEACSLGLKQSAQPCPWVKCNDLVEDHLRFWAWSRCASQPMNQYRIPLRHTVCVLSTLDVACHLAKLWLRSAVFKFNMRKCKKKSLGWRSWGASLTAQKQLTVLLVWGLLLI